MKNQNSVFFICLLLLISIDTLSQNYQNKRQYQGSSAVEQIIVGQWYDRAARTLITVKQEGVWSNGDPYLKYEMSKNNTLFEKGRVKVYRIENHTLFKQMLVFRPANGKSYKLYINSSHVNRIVLQENIGRGKWHSITWNNVRFGG